VVGEDSGPAQDGDGRLAEVGKRLDAALRLFREANQRDGVMIVQHHLGELARKQGRWEEAAARFGASHAAAVESRDARMEARGLIGLGQVARARGDLVEARRRLGAAAALLEGLPAFLPPGAAAEFAGACAAVLAAAGAPAAGACCGGDAGISLPGANDPQ
jgi:hypothetical protein